jgi:hypothetical protein
MRSVIPIQGVAESRAEVTARFVIDIWYVNKMTERLITPPLTLAEYDTMIAELKELKKTGEVTVPIDLEVMGVKDTQNLVVFPTSPTDQGSTSVRVWSVAGLLADTVLRWQVIPTTRR